MRSVVWFAKPANNILNDSYYQAALPILDRQLAVGGLRLARFLNEAFLRSPVPPSESIDTHLIRSVDMCFHVLYKHGQNERDHEEGQLPQLAAYVRDL